MSRSQQSSVTEVKPDDNGELSNATESVNRLPGDTPEAVYPALKLAYQQFTWMPEHDKTLVLVGDAPPHIGLGTKCAQLAAIALDKAELATHVIQAGGKDVKHFATIAEAGGGKCVTLKDDDSLVAEIAGLTLGDAFEEEFREFFQVYLELCR